MEYGTGTGITIVNRTHSLRVGYVMEGLVAIVVVDSVGEGTGRHCRCMSVGVSQVMGR